MVVYRSDRKNKGGKVIPIEYFLDPWSWIWVHPAMADLYHYFLFHQAEMFFYFAPGYPVPVGQPVPPVWTAPVQPHTSGCPQPTPAGMPPVPGDRVNTLPPLCNPELFVKMKR